MRTIHKDFVIFGNLALPRQTHHSLLIFNRLVVLPFDDLIIHHQVILPLTLTLPSLQTRPPLLRSSFLITDGVLDCSPATAFTGGILGSLRALCRSVQVLGQKCQFLRE